MSNSILALVMALCMLLSPAATGTSLMSEIPPVTITVQAADGTNFSGGLTNTTDGQPALFFSSNGIGLAMTDDTGYVTDTTGTYAVPVEQLMQLAASAVSSIPQPTEDDMMAVMLFAQGVMSGVSQKSFNLSMMGTGISFTLDVDQLCDELHTVVPTVLNTYAAYLDPTLAKYTPYLFGEVVTSAQLAQIWPQLGLDQVETDLAAQLTVLQSGDTVTLIGSVAGCNFIATISESALSFSLTTPDGVTYAFDTADIMVLTSIMSSVFQHITSSAFSYEQNTTTSAYGYNVVTTTIKLDTTALSNDLNRGLAYTVALNSTVVDQLLNKYRSWIALLDESLARQLTAATLSQAFNVGMIELPAATGELVVSQDMYTGCITVDGYFANVTLTGSINSSYYQAGADFTLSVNDRYDPLILNLSYAEDTYEGTTWTLTSSAKLFDAFNVLSFNMSNSRYSTYWHLTTDTDVLRLDYSDDEQYMDIKVGPVSAYLKVDENDVVHANFYCPEFFVDLHGGETFFNLDSTIGGFDFAENYNGFVLNGYLADHYRYRTTFGLTFVDSYDVSGLTGYLNTSDGECYMLEIGDEINFTVNGDVYTITPVEMDSYDQVGLTFSYNGVVGTTMIITDANTQMIAELYEGTDLTAAPMCTVTIDFAPAAFTAPADATVVDVMTFLNKVEALLQF